MENNHIPNPSSFLSNMISEATKSICQLDFGQKLASGFLIKMKKGNEPFYCLMSCEHIINKNLKNKDSFIIYYNKGKIFFKISKKDRRFRKDFRYLDMCIIVIEILTEDNIEEEFFLNATLYNYSDVMDKTLYILQYPKEEQKYNYLEGKINSITLYEFTYLANNFIAPGNPIFVLIDNNLVIVGITKKKTETEFYGCFVYPAIISLQKNYKFKGHTFNYGKYIGEFLNEKRQGYGKLVKPNNSYYVGEWLNNYEDGRGIIYADMTSQNKNIIYEGYFKNGKPNGYGKCFYENGNYYIGEFLDGVRHGKGIIYYQNGKIKYEGNFINDICEGEGKYIWENGEYYIGEFHNNLREGKGKEYYKDGTPEFEGDFSFNKYHGKGVFYWKNGNYYIGEWRNGFKHGNGIIYSKDNNIIYKGYFMWGQKFISDNNNSDNGIIIV